MYLKTFERGPDRNLTYLFGPLGSTATLACVDPGRDVKPLLKEAGKRKIHYIFATHGHGDHIEGLLALKEKTGGIILGHRLISRDLEAAGIPLDEPLTGGQTLDIDGLPVRVLYTPGHQLASICLEVGNEALFTGDTLFVGNCGRADLPGSDPYTLWVSLQMLGNLADELVVYPGHDYGKSKTSTIAKERAENPCMRAQTFEEFEAIP